MKQTLQQTTSQHLSLTPQLKQSLEILQLSNIELERLIDKELIENPLLDREDSSLGEQEVHEITPATDQEHLWQTSSADHSVLEHGRENQNPIEQTVADQESLREYLLSQIRVTTLTDRDQFIAEALIYSIDKDGYLTADVKEIVALLPLEMEIDVEEIQAVLSLVKTLDPIGVGAADLRERLLILLAVLPEEESPSDSEIRSIASALIQDYLPLLANRNFTELENRLGLSRLRLREAVDLITQLNPRVTNRFSAVQKNQLTPDVVISLEGEVWVANLNARLQPRLNVNNTYLKLLKVSPDQKSTEFLDQHLGKARSFMKAVGNRYETLLAVAQVITNNQQAFFSKGDQHLQPMVMKVIADELGVHESTISRAVNGKYLQCPQGVFELKYFFSSEVGGSQGDGSSSTAIRSLIKQFISAESSKKPLSDSKLVQELLGSGHVVARRTVAKYRESLNIPPSSKRKTL